MIKFFLLQKAEDNVHYELNIIFLIYKLEQHGVALV